ncbi:MAG: site-2 protease family protein [Acidobacteriota bacterium]|nr:site-2 protease family protein [Acidobacteriota bacterium]
MRWSWKIGRLAGINVYMHATFLLLVLFVLYVNFSGGRDATAAVIGVVFVLIVFAFVVLHELGHALAARRYGVETRDIILLPIGGVARLERMPEKPSEELVVAIAGPLVNVAIALGLLAVLLSMGVRPQWVDFRTMGGGFLEELMIVNVWLVAFNLLPAFPMDGGRVLRALLATRMEYPRATKVAARIGQGMAVIFAIAGLFSDPWLVFIAIFVWMGADAESASAIAGRSSTALVPVGRVMVTDFRTLGPDDTLQDAVDRALAGWQQDFPVVWGDRVLGLLTHSDLSRAIAQYGPNARVRQAMQREFPAVQAQDTLQHAMALLQASGSKSIPVQHEGRLVGLLDAQRAGQYLMLQSALLRKSEAGNSQAVSPPNQEPKPDSDPVKS